MSPPAMRHRLYRSEDDKILGGVAAGLAAHLRVPVAAVRLAFVAAVAARGFGVAAYLAFWAFVPQAIPTGVPAGRRSAAAWRVAFLGLVSAAVLLVREVGVGPSDRTLWPAVAGVTGVVVLWRQADAAQRARWRAPGASPSARLRGALSLVVGAVLVVGGAAAYLSLNVQVREPIDLATSLVVAVAVLVALSAPWWWRLASDFRREREARIRSQERAEVAAHLHDSVLQTLMLIQRNVSSPRDVARLARRQERELRAWLYGGRAGPATLSAALHDAAAEIEDTHGVRADVVLVGDREVDERLGALVQAAREAMVNAAKHSGADEVSVYAEVEPSRVAVYVRDRGAGFDPRAVAPDRYGIRESIYGRMARHGGRATVRSARGEGTEIELELPS